MAAMRFFTLRPTHFLGFLPLQQGVDIVVMTSLINKLSGVFGVLALVTGAAISITQISMYLYSLAAFIGLCILAPHIHARSPLAALAFAYLYVIDSVVNAAYTVTFGFDWFMPKEEELLVVERDATAPMIMQPESAASIAVISGLWAIKLYFIVLVFANAREVVRASATPAEAPFEKLEGWKGRVGRAMVTVGRGYWEGDGWMEFGAKFRRSSEPRGHRRFGSQRLEVEV